MGRKRNKTQATGKVHMGFELPVELREKAVNIADMHYNGSLSAYIRNLIETDRRKGHKGEK